MNRFKVQQLAGWGNYPTATCNVYRPEKLAEVRALASSNDQSSLIPRGLGRSYGDAALNENAGVLLYERLNRLLDFNPITGDLTAEAGVTFEEILNLFLPRGFFPPVTPGTKFVTLGGAIAADVHGKNHHRHGCISEFVESFDLLTGRDEILHCSRSENQTAFWATIGGMGLTGIILSAKLRLTPVPSAYITVDYKRTLNLDQTLEAFSQGDAAYPYSVAWIDCLASGKSLGRSVLMRGNHAALSDLAAHHRRSPLNPKSKNKKTMPFFLPGFALSHLSVKAFNSVFYARHTDGRRIVDYDSFFYPLDSINHWNRMYGRRGFVQYQAALPPDTSHAGLIAMLEELSRSGRASFLAVLKTFGPQNAGLLSFPRAGQTLAIDLPNTGPSMRDLLRRLDAIVLKNGGRVYLAKDACLDHATFESMYPRLNEFKQVKSQLDPHNRFSSTQARRLGIVEAK
jgi:decaprenylphospho-beta-D-ribofuranose 2-oxidase